MKLWSRLCFLVLVVSPICLGNNTTNHPGNEGSLTTATPPPVLPEENGNHPSSDNSTLGEKNNTTTDDADSNNVTQIEETTKLSAILPTEVKGTVATHTSSVSTTTPISPTTVAPVSGSSAGYVVLGFIIIVIIVLCIILYLLRRASRTYSFDLQRPSPANHLNQPTGTFEPVYLDDLERPVPKDIAATDDLSPPVANGTSLHSEEKDSTGETAPDEQPEANGVETSPTDNTSSGPSLGSDEADKISDPPSSTNLFFDALGEQQNENNNNPISTSDPFVEINLDEPAWCDQLFNSSEASSSVLPFSPFSLSSSSS